MSRFLCIAVFAMAALAIAQAKSPVDGTFPEIQFEVSADGKCDGGKVRRGDTVFAEYTGFLPNKEVFDHSNESFIVVGDNNHLTRGLEEGILGMCVNETRVIFVPAKFGYGNSEQELERHQMLGPTEGVKEQKFAKIPANTDLVYHVTLREIEKDVPRPPNQFSAMDVNHDGKITKDEFDAFQKNVFADHKQPGAPFQDFRDWETFVQMHTMDSDDEISWLEYRGAKGRSVDDTQMYEKPEDSKYYEGMDLGDENSSEEMDEHYDEADDSEMGSDAEGEQEEQNVGEEAVEKEDVADEGTEQLTDERDAPDVEEASNLSQEEGSTGEAAGAAKESAGEL